MARKIVCDPDIMFGKPTFEGTRIPVHVVLTMLANGFTPERLTEEYEALTLDDISNALHYAASYVEEPIKTIAAE